LILVKVYVLKAGHFLESLGLLVSKKP